MRIHHETKFHATFIGRGEFYTGISHDERVVLTVHTTVYHYDGRDCSSSSLSVQNFEQTSAHLSVQLSDLANIYPY